MIEETFDPKSYPAIELGDSPKRELSNRAMEVIPPSPSSRKDLNAGGNSESTSRQDIDSKPKMEV